VIGFDAHDDAFGVDLVNDAVALAENDRAGIASGNALHAGADKRSFSANQRNALALHVGTHERAVGVVVSRNGIKLAATDTSCFGETST